MTTEQFINEIDGLRKACRGQWYLASGTVHGQPYRIKAYKTWIQLAYCGPYNFSGPMDCTVKTFREHLRKIADYAETQKGMHTIPNRHHTAEAI